MDMKQDVARDLSDAENPVRCEWTKPSLVRLRAGSAENTLGNTINDGTLETIGS